MIKFMGVQNNNDYFVLTIHVAPTKQKIYYPLDSIR